METYQLYQFDSCPFCYRVREFLQRADMEIPIRDTLRESQAARELLEGGGSTMVPCLRIERDGAVSWLYESLDIIDYLRHRLADQQQRGRSTAREETGD